MTGGLEGTDTGMDSRRLTSLALHALFIGIIFILPEALLRVAIPDRTLEISWPMYAKSAITIGVFYLNYFLVVPRTLIHGKSKRRWRFVMLNLLIVVVGAVSIWIIYRYIYHGPRASRYQLPLAGISYVLRDAIMLVLAVSLAVALRLSGRWVELERRHQQLMAVRRQTELDSLRSQLNPHFLFNTLNAIYALISISPEQAQMAIHRLSALLRYVVYDNPRVVPLDLEVEFVTNYVELMRLRMGDRPVTLTIERHDDAGVEIAPLLLVSLVENAFKHGNTSDTSKPIDIRLTSNGHTVACTTQNHIDEPASQAARATGRGVGLANLRRRIELLYESRAMFVAGPSEDGTYTARLSITINPESP